MKLFWTIVAAIIAAKVIDVLVTMGIAMIAQIVEAFKH
jgi:hypothetical protein